MAAHLDPAAVGIRGHMLGLGPGLRVGEPGGDLLVLDGSVGLQREQPVSAPLRDEPRGLTLAVRRIRR
jgi:hypothetical protein